MVAVPGLSMDLRYSFISSYILCEAITLINFPCQWQPWFYNWAFNYNRAEAAGAFGIYP